MDAAASDIGILGLVTSLVLVAVAVALSRWQRLGLEAPMLWACSRAMAQLLVVGLALTLVIDPDQPVALAWAWVVLMVVVAAMTVGQRARTIDGLRSLALVSLSLSTGVALVVIFGLGIFPTQGRAIVPVSGMMVGNSLTATVVAARRIVGELADKRPEVEARLALGHPWPVASRPYVREALRTALVPQIESTKAVGLVFLPGAMTGLVLAGVDPIDAVLVQAAVMFLILGAAATTVTVVGIGLTRRVFTPDHRLVRLERSAG